MNTADMARGYIFWAKHCLSEAEMAINMEHYPAVVRRSQESLELATKALLRSQGIEYPKAHDVSEAFAGIIKNLPFELQEKVNVWISLLEELAEKREIAFYGFERENIPPDKIFTQDYDRDIYKKVKEIVEIISLFLNHTLSND